MLELILGLDVNLEDISNESEQITKQKTANTMRTTREAGSQLEIGTPVQNGCEKHKTNTWPSF